MLSMISLDSVSLSFEFIGLRRGVVFSACVDVIVSSVSIFDPASASVPFPCAIA